MQLFSFKNLEIKGVSKRRNTWKYTKKKCWLAPPTQGSFVAFFFFFFTTNFTVSLLIDDRRCCLLSLWPSLLNWWTQLDKEDLNAEILLGICVRLSSTSTCVLSRAGSWSCDITGSGSRGLCLAGRRKSFWRRLATLRCWACRRWGCLRLHIPHPGSVSSQWPGGGGNQSVSLQGSISTGVLSKVTKLNKVPILKNCWVTVWKDLWQALENSSIHLLLTAV